MYAICFLALASAAYSLDPPRTLQYGRGCCISGLRRHRAGGAGPYSLTTWSRCSASSCCRRRSSRQWSTSRSGRWFSDRSPVRRARLGARGHGVRHELHLPVPSPARLPERTVSCRSGCAGRCGPSWHLGGLPGGVRAHAVRLAGRGARARACTSASRSTCAPAGHDAVGRASWSSHRLRRAGPHPAGGGQGAARGHRAAHRGRLHRPEDRGHTRRVSRPALQRPQGTGYAVATSHNSYMNLLLNLGWIGSSWHSLQSPGRSLLVAKRRVRLAAVLRHRLRSAAGARILRGADLAWAGQLHPAADVVRAESGEDAHFEFRLSTQAEARLRWR
jgi:hypothetical protein